MRFPCLVLDHDDTVVQSEMTVNFPYFLQVLADFRPGETSSIFPTALRAHISWALNIPGRPWPELSS